MIFQAKFQARNVPVELGPRMEIACEALTERPEGVASELPEAQFLDLFLLAAKRCEATEDQTAAVEKYLRSAAERQSGRLMPQNLKSSDCPALI